MVRVKKKVTHHESIERPFRLLPLHMSNPFERQLSDRTVAKWFTIINKVEPGFEMRVKFAVGVLDAVCIDPDHLTDALVSLFFRYSLSTLTCFRPEILLLVGGCMRKGGDPQCHSCHLL